MDARTKNYGGCNTSKERNVARIDEEIKIEELRSSSTNNHDVTSNNSSSSSFVNTRIDIDSAVNNCIRRVKTEEEGVDDTITSTSNMNCDLDRLVKKEEEPENNDDDDDDDDDDTKINFKEAMTGARYCDNDYDYSDWKVGNWCWLLPATDNKDEKTTTQRLPTRSVKSEDGGNITSASTMIISANNNNNNIAKKTSSSSSSLRSRATRETKIQRATDRKISRQCQSIDDETAPATDEASRPKKKKKRTNGNYLTSANEDYNTTKQKECIEEREYNHKNAAVSTATVDNGADVNCNNDVDYNGNMFKQSDNNYKGDGYESWTEGNWCLLLPPPPYSEKIETEQQSHDLPSTKRTRNCRRTQSSSDHVEVGDEDKNELDEDYVENDDGNDHSNSIGTKAGKRTIRYTKKRNENWNEMYQKLVAYKKEHKSTYVPHNCVSDPKLGRWVISQRSKYYKKDMSMERINRLESIGFVWDPLDAQWMKMYNRLVVYKMQHKSTNVPYNYIEDPPLGRWTYKQRYRKNESTGKRLDFLNSINFAW